MNSLNGLKDKWGELAPQQRTYFLKYGSAVVVITLIFGSYFLSDHSEKVAVVESQVQRMDLGTGLLEDDIRSEVEAQLSNQDQVNADMDGRFLALETMMTELAAVNELSSDVELGSTLEPGAVVPTSLAGEQRMIDDKYDGVEPTKSPYPPPPQQQQQRAPATLSAVFPSVPMSESAPAEPQFIGAVARSVGTPLPEVEPLGKKNDQFLMPPGFMQAKLLTGVESLTSGGGSEDGEPLMFRVQAPAILPNDLKANLKGCFVIGNGYGSLAKERVQIRLVSLHCVAQDGTGVVDEQIKGWVTGKDGKKGLPGIVVTKAGALIARSFVAGIFDGIGQAITLDTVTQSVSPLGATNVIDPEQALQAGLGQGIKSGSAKIQELYLEWARQSSPVIEVGAAMDCTIVIQESVVLNIQDWRGKANDTL